MTEPMALNDPRHGTVNGYGNLRCRCDDCRAAWAEYFRGLRAARTARGLPPDDPRHGTQNGYNNCGCRCTDCTTAHRIEHQQWRLRATNPKGV